jgi:hypothetical protein
MMDTADQVISATSTTPVIAGGIGAVFDVWDLLRPWYL